MSEMPSVEVLLQSLRDTSWKVRSDAARRLRDLNKENVSEQLLAAAFDDDFSVRLAVVEALSGYTDPRVLETLQQCLFDEDWEVQWAAMRSLGSIWKEPDLRKMGDKLPEKRIAGIEAVAKKDAKQYSLLLYASLDDELEEVQAAAIRALGVLGQPEAIVPLRKCFDDASPGIQALLIEILSSLGEEQANEEGKDFLQCCDECNHRLPPSYLFRVKTFDDEARYLCQFHFDEYVDKKAPLLGKQKQCKMCKTYRPKVELFEGGCPECREKRYHSFGPDPEDAFRCFRSHKMRPLRDRSPISPPNQPLSSKSAFQLSQLSAVSPFLTPYSIRFLERAYDNGFLLCENCKNFVPMENIVEGYDFRDECICSSCKK